jgi:hypothetical protein
VIQPKNRKSYLRANIYNRIRFKTILFW